MVAFKIYYSNLLIISYIVNPQIRRMKYPHIKFFCIRKSVQISQVLHILKKNEIKVKLLVPFSNSSLL